MTTAQLCLSIAVPMLFNAGSIGLLLAYINARFDGMNESINRRFDAIDRRFGDIRSWRSEFHRVGEVLDARLKPSKSRAETLHPWPTADRRPTEYTGNS